MTTNAVVPYEPLPAEVPAGINPDWEARMRAHLDEVFGWHDSRPWREITEPPQRKVKAFSVASLRGRAMFSLPVAVAEFDGGEKIRMTFWQEAHRPWAFDRARRLVAQVVGNERARGAGALINAVEARALERKAKAAEALANDTGTTEGERENAADMRKRLRNRRKALDVMRDIEAKLDRLPKAGAPATDFVSFHVEHDGRQINPLAIAAPKPLLAPRVRKPRPEPCSMPEPAVATPPAAAVAAPPALAVSEHLARLEAELGVEAVEIFLASTREFMTREGKMRAFRGRRDQIEFRIHVHKKDAA